MTLEQASETGHILSRIGGVGAGALLGSGVGVLPALAAAGVGGALTTAGGLTRTGLALKRAGDAAKWGPEAYRLLSLLEQLELRDGVD